MENQEDSVVFENSKNRKNKKQKLPKQNTQQAQKLESNHHDNQQQQSKLPTKEIFDLRQFVYDEDEIITKIDFNLIKQQPRSKQFLSFYLEVMKEVVKQSKQHYDQKEMNQTLDQCLDFVVSDLNRIMKTADEDTTKSIENKQQVDYTRQRIRVVNEIDRQWDIKHKNNQQQIQQFTNDMVGLLQESNQQIEFQIKDNINTGFLGKMLDEQKGIFKQNIEFKQKEIQKGKALIDIMSEKLKKKFIEKVKVPIKTEYEAIPLFY